MEAFLAVNEAATFGAHSNRHITIVIVGSKNWKEFTRFLAWASEQGKRSITIVLQSSLLVLETNIELGWAAAHPLSFT
jgi:hypothetical protein